MRLRLLERRFFTKLDDKKTGSIQSISNFLKATHQVTIKEIQALENAKKDLTRCVWKLDLFFSMCCDFRISVQRVLKVINI